MHCAVLCEIQVLSYLRDYASEVLLLVESRERHYFVAVVYPKYSVTNFLEVMEAKSFHRIANAADRQTKPYMPPIDNYCYLSHERHTKPY